jgi:hypothetical protein
MASTKKPLSRAAKAAKSQCNPYFQSAFHRESLWSVSLRIPNQD